MGKHYRVSGVVAGDEFGDPCRGKTYRVPNLYVSPEQSPPAYMRVVVTFEPLDEAPDGFDPDAWGFTDEVIDSSQPGD